MDGLPTLRKTRTGVSVMAPTQAILVIDDEPDILLAVQVILQRTGYQVLTADDGAAGIERAIRERPNLVIADLMMPRSSGFPCPAPPRDRLRAIA